MSSASSHIPPYLLQLLDRTKWPLTECLCLWKLFDDINTDVSYWWLVSCLLCLLVELFFPVWNQNIRKQHSNFLLFIHPSFCLILSFSGLLCFTSPLFTCPAFSVLCPHLLVFLTQQMVPEDLRPALTEQGQSNRRVQHRLDSPVQAEPPAASPRPAQVVLCCGHWETLFTHWYLLRLRSVRSHVLWSVVELVHWCHLV